MFTANGDEAWAALFVAMAVVCVVWWVFRNLRTFSPGLHWSAQLADMTSESFADLKRRAEAGVFSAKLRLAWTLTARQDYGRAGEAWEDVLKSAPENLRGFMAAQKTSFHCEEARDEISGSSEDEWAVLYSTILHGRSTRDQKRRFVVEAVLRDEEEDALRVAGELRRRLIARRGHAVVQFKDGSRKKYDALLDLAHSLADTLECLTEHDGYTQIPLARIKKLVLGPPDSCWVRAEIQEYGEKKGKYVMFPLLYRGSLQHEDALVRQGMVTLPEDGDSPLSCLGHRVFLGFANGAPPTRLPAFRVFSVEFFGPAPEYEDWSYKDPLETA